MKKIDTIYGIDNSNVVDGNMKNRERKQELIALQIACLQILKDSKLPFEVMKIIEGYMDGLAKENFDLMKHDIPMLIVSKES